jgi:hypothetical protein
LQEMKQEQDGRKEGDKEESDMKKVRDRMKDG